VGFQVVGCDPSADGIRNRKRGGFPTAAFKQIGTDNDPAAIGESNFDAVISTEVVERLFHPHRLPRFRLPCFFARVAILLSAHLITVI